MWAAKSYLLKGPLNWADLRQPLTGFGFGYEQLCVVSSLLAGYFTKMSGLQVGVRFGKNG
jgi:hypothetical protein